MYRNASVFFLLFSASLQLIETQNSTNLFYAAANISWAALRRLFARQLAGRFCDVLLSVF